MPMNPLDWPGRESLVDGPPDDPSVILSAGPAHVREVQDEDLGRLPLSKPAGFVLP